jgi:FAD/FMN-containing dehydrogenase
VLIVPGRFSELARLLPGGSVRTDPETLATYGRDWVRLHEPRASAVVFPTDTEQAVTVVRWARQARIALVPSGGRTGLSGGALAHNGQLVVSCERMDRILHFSADDALLTGQAGVTIKRVQDAAKSAGLYYPIDFAPSATMQLGGTIATNAGGVHVVRFGMTRAWVAGMKVVVACGEGDASVLDLSNSVAKNNTGYDLKQLFIGSEGTLGLITEATVRLAAPPGASSVALLAVDDTASLVAIGSEARAHGIVSAVEFWDDAGMELATAHLKSDRPLPQARWYVLAEIEGAAAAANWAKACEGKGLCRPGVARVVPADAASDLWAIRLAIGTAVAPFTPYKNDISVPVSALPRFLPQLESRLADRPETGRLVLWGHLLDGNLHVNFLKPESASLQDFAATCRRLDDSVYTMVSHHHGSISAEHGIGLLKKHALHHSRSPGELAAMRAIKAHFDPDGIMNPGKIFDAQEAEGTSHG